MFTTFDLLALGTVLGCTAISAMRGMISELFDFGGWIVSLILARTFATPAAAVVFPAMQPRAMAVVCSFVLIFILTRLLQHFLRFAFNSAIRNSKLTTGVNRIMGGILGSLKGILFVSIAVFALSFSSLPRSLEWQQAVTAPFFETLVKAAVPYLPEIFADQVHFPREPLEPDEPKKKRRRPPALPPVEQLSPRGY